MTTQVSPKSLLALRALNPIAVRVMCLLCCVPMLVLHADEIWRFHHFRHLPFVAAGFLVLIRQSTLRERTAVFISPWWDRVMLVLAALCLSYAVLHWRPLWSALSAAFVCVSTIVWFRQKGYLDRFLPLIFFLIFFLRFPWQLDLKLLYLLQGVSATWASTLLDTIQVNHVLTGSVIWHGGATFFAHEAYNGIPLLFTVMAVTCWWQIFRRRTVPHALLVMCSSVVWTVGVNVIWMVTTVWLTSEYQFDLQQAPWHSLTRIAVFMCTMSLVLCVDLAAAHYPNRTQWVMWQSESTALPDEAQSLLKPDFFGIGILVSFATLGVVQISRYVVDPPQLSASSKAALLTFERGDLPQSIDGWELNSFDVVRHTDSDMRGLNEARWQYQRDTETMTVLTRYPFFQWHDVIRCYRVGGDDSSDIEVSAEDALPNTVAIRLTTADGLPGQAFVTCIRPDGEARRPKLSVSARSVGQEIRQNLTTETATPFDAFNQPAYEIQLIHVGASSMKPDTQQQAKDLFVRMREALLTGRLKEGVSSE